MHAHADRLTILLVIGKGEERWIKVDGKHAPYDSYFTNWFEVDGQAAWCGNPSMATPGAGSYPKQALSAASGRTAELAADMWFSYGSPGFDASLWPGSWVDGSAMIRSLVFDAVHRPGFSVRSIAATDLPDDIVSITVIVESPTKAHKIGDYLGKGYTVMASVGKRTSSQSCKGFTGCRAGRPSQP